MSSTGGCDLSRVGRRTGAATGPTGAPWSRSSQASADCARRSRRTPRAAAAAALARLGLELERRRRQPQGDDIDIDAAVEARVDALAGSAPDEDVYIDSLRRRRDLRVLVLLDVSGSAGEPSATGGTVHEQQRAAAAALTVALARPRRPRRALRLPLAGPVGRPASCRSSASTTPSTTSVLRRLGGLVPGAYTRLGAAIRHGASVLEREGGTPRRLLVVLSDGFAYDHGYEGAYGEADARRALAEARRRGIGCLCLSVGAGTDAAALRRVFGTAAHATIPRAEQLPTRRRPAVPFRAAVGGGAAAGVAAHASARVNDSTIERRTA